MEKFAMQFYEKVYESIMDERDGIEIEDTGDDWLDVLLELEVDGYELELTATFHVEYVDDSFSHAFGIEERHHAELDYLDGIDGVRVWDGEGDECTSLFSEQEFLSQFSLGSVNIHGHEFTAGDRVVVKLHYGEWKEATYRGSDARTGMHTCEDASGRRFRTSTMYPPTSQYLLLTGCPGT